MSLPTSIDPDLPIDYPESDGEPMGETDVHIDELVALLESLKDRYRDARDVYVAGDNFLYYEEGNPSAVISPDLYVVKGVEKRQRRTYKLWEEQQREPCFVLELSSRKTWLEDIGNKKALCARLGVAEYFLYDPEADVVKPPLQGFRLVEGEYRRIEPRDDGAVESEQLGLWLWLDAELRLHCTDVRTGEQLLRPGEVRAAHRQAEQQRDEALARAQAAERELAELRKRLADAGTGGKGRS